MSGRRIKIWCDNLQDSMKVWRWLVKEHPIEMDAELRKRSIVIKLQSYEEVKTFWAWLTDNAPDEVTKMELC